MIRRRGRDVHLADGPGKLAQALAIEGRHDGVDLFGGGEVGLEPGGPPAAVTATTRVGITKATGRPWRFLAGGWAAPSR
jgi:DNA-3-methyladenine glycosylase